MIGRELLMALVGRALLILGLGVCVYGIGASVYGARHPPPRRGSTRAAARSTRSPR